MGNVDRNRDVRRDGDRERQSEREIGHHRQNVKGRDLYRLIQSQ